MAKGLYDITPLEPLIAQGCILLTPNYRLARRIKAEWDARRATLGERVWEPLAVQPLESWLLQQWDLAVSLGLLSPITPLNTAQTFEVWRQVISQQEQQSAGYHLLRPAVAAELANQARDTLKRWQVDMGARGIRQSFGLERDCGTFLQWLTLFEARLALAHQCTQVDCLVQLVNLQGQLPVSSVVLVEFEEIPPLLCAALEGLNADVREPSPRDARAERLLHSYSDTRAELQAVASWAAQLHAASPAATIGIVLSDMSGDRISLEYLLRREFDCLGENYNSLPVNFSTGITLAEAPLVRDALQVLSVCRQQTTVPSVVRLLRSRFLNLPDAQSALSQKFVTRLYREGREVLTLADLRDATAAISQNDPKGLVLGQHLQAVYRMHDLRRAAVPSVWADRFSAVLSLWGWPGTQGLDSLEYQQLELWFRTLDEFRALDAVCKAISLNEALGLLSDCCRRQVSQPQTADSPVQVLGPLEAAGLSFEYLWVCGMQGTSWPASPRPNPFIPVSLQSRMHMPHATPEREWAYSAALLQQYLRSNPVLHASYARQIDGVADLPSALLRDFTPQDAPEPSRVAAQWIESHGEAVIEEIPDHQAPPLEPGQLAVASGGSSLIEDQSHCPFRAFTRHRLQVEPLGAFSVTLSAADRGSLLHAALFSLWGEICDHASLLALSDEQQKQATTRATESALATVPAFRYHQLGTAYWQLEGQRLTSLLQEWLAVERQRGAFAVVQREQDVVLELAQLSLRLRVDRVDQLPDGSRVIIDYKSGSSTIQDWLGERPAKPQLLLYRIVEPESVAALAFAQLQPHKCRFVGLGRVAAAPGISINIASVAKSQAEGDVWTTLNTQWHENLERLARAFVRGDAEIDPLTSASCIWCGLQSLCRVDITDEMLLTEDE